MIVPDGEVMARSDPRRLSKEERHLHMCSLSMARIKSGLKIQTKCVSFYKSIPFINLWIFPVVSAHVKLLR